MNTIDLSQFVKLCTWAYGQKHFKSEFVVFNVLDKRIKDFKDLISEGNLLLKKNNEERTFKTKGYHCYGYSFKSLIKYYILPGSTDDSVILLAGVTDKDIYQLYLHPLEMIINVDEFYLRTVP